MRNIIGKDWVLKVDIIKQETATGALYKAIIYEGRRGYCIDTESDVSGGGTVIAHFEERKRPRKDPAKEAKQWLQKHNLEATWQTRGIS